MFIFILIYIWRGIHISVAELTFVLCQHRASVPMAAGHIGLINSTVIFTEITQFSDNGKSLLSNELRWSGFLSFFFQYHIGS